MTNRTTPKHGRPYGSKTSVGMTRHKALMTLPPVVYAVEVSGYVKIGHSVCFGRRIYSYGPATEILAYRPGTIADERAAHKLLKRHLAHGREWYHRSPAVIDFVNTMRTDLGLPSIQA